MEELNNALAEINVAMPATIVSYNAGNQRATVKPSLSFVGDDLKINATPIYYFIWKLTAYLSQRKETLLTTLANKADALKLGLLVGYPQTEIESFYRQEKEALA